MSEIVIARLSARRDAILEPPDTLPRLPGLPADPAFTAFELTTLRPTPGINGMWRGHTRAGTGTVVPAKAHATLTIRLGPGTDPARTRPHVVTHLRVAVPKSVWHRFTADESGTPAACMGDNHPLLIAASPVPEQMHGRRPIPARADGTIPVSGIFRKMRGTDTLTDRRAIAGEDAHAPNKLFWLSSWDEGLKTWPMLLTELGKPCADERASFRH